METIDLSRFILSFLIVLGLIGAMAFVLKRYNGVAKKILSDKSTGGRLEILEVRYLDPKRKLMLVRRDEVEHLLLLADSRETVIETNIVSKDKNNAA